MSTKDKGGMAAWLQAARLPFLTATFVPVLLGAVIGWYETSKFNWLTFGPSLIGMACIHIGTNMANDYYDFKSGNDVVNKFPTPFSGGSRVLVEKLLTPKAVLAAALMLFCVGSVIGLYLNWICSGNVILYLGIAGVFLGFFYSASPINLCATGLGELATGVGFGTIAVVGAYFVQAQQLSWTPVWASVPVTIFIALVLYINEFPDHQADEAVGKRTIVVRLGKARAVKIYLGLLVGAYLFILVAVMLGLFPVYALITFLTAGMAFKALKVAGKNFDKITELLPANASTIGLHLSTGILLALAFFLDKIL